MYLVAGTFALAGLISMMTSWWAPNLPVFSPVPSSALIPPCTFFLKRLFVILAIYMGLRYVSKGVFRLLHRAVFWLMP
jgi:hypothetical protein